MNKQIFIILAGILITGTAMAALMNDKMKTTVMCKDARIAMNGGLATGIEVGGLKRHTAVTLYTQKINGKTTLVKQGSLNVSHFIPTQSGVNQDKYTGENIELTVSRVKDQRSGKYPASIKANLEGQKFAANLLCHSTR
ncbi:MAG: hypothetical protein SGI74_13810 [Oligoflexia bacterium]|nr:hypothetical protein [Oligoflexia bacterium]